MLAATGYGVSYFLVTMLLEESRNQNAEGRKANAASPTKVET